MAAYGYLTLLLCFTSVVWALRTPTISHISQMQIKDVGSQVDLECSAHTANEYWVLWLKLNHHKTTFPISSNGGLIVQDPRFSLKFDKATETYTLSIRDLKESDSGRYQCMVLMWVNRNITAEVELRVRRPPTISNSVY